LDRLTAGVARRAPEAAVYALRDCSVLEKRRPTVNSDAHACGRLSGVNKQWRCCASPLYVAAPGSFMHSR